MGGVEGRNATKPEATKYASTDVRKRAVRRDEKTNSPTIIKASISGLSLATTSRSSRRCSRPAYTVMLYVSSKNLPCSLAAVTRALR